MEVIGRCVQRDEWEMRGRMNVVVQTFLLAHYNIFYHVDITYYHSCHVRVELGDGCD